MARCFIGLALPPSTHQALRPLLTALGHLRDPRAQIRPVPERNLHCTLKFLGAASGDQIIQLEDALAETVAMLQPFGAQVAGVSCFGAPRPRAIYACIDRGRAAVIALGEKLDALCEPMGFPREPRPRVPHVTLARVDGAHDDREIMAWVQQHPPETGFGPLDTAAIHLYQSEAGPNGSMYTPLRSFVVG